MPARLQPLAAMALLALVAAACSKADTRPVTSPETPAPTGPGVGAALASAPGKWRHEITMDGRVLPVTEFCSSGGSVISISATESQTSCSRTENQSGGWRIECTAPDGTTSTATQTFTGNRESAFTLETLSEIHPADGSGPRSSQTIVKATRLGDC